MRRSVRKAIAFITFLAMALQTFIFSDAAPVSAAEPKFVIEGGYICNIENPTEEVTIPAGLDADYISLYLSGTGIKKLTIKGEYSSVYISYGEDLEELVIPKNVSDIGLAGLNNLKVLNIGSGCEGIYMYALDALDSLTLPDSLSYLSLGYMSSLKTLSLNKGLESYEQYGCPDLKVTIPASVRNLYADDYSNITVDSNNPYYEIYNGSLYDGEKFLVKAADTATLNIKEGTIGIRAQALCNAFAITTVNMPDSLLYLDDHALAGGINVKKLTVSKNLLSIQSYAFTGFGADAIKLPSTLEYVASDAFSGYYGSISLDGDHSPAIIKYGAGIYKPDYNPGEYSLIYYAKNKTKLDLHRNCTSIEDDAINGCPFTALDVPEGVTYFGAALDKCTKLKTINLPASLTYFDDYYAAMHGAPNLQKFTVDSDNETYATYDGCLYTKDKETLCLIPHGKAEVRIISGCVTMRFYSIGERYTYDPEMGYSDKPLTIEFPASMKSFTDYYVYSLYAKVESGSAAAQWVSDYNSWSWYPISYEFTDTSKEILSKIAVPDQITLKKGKKAEIGYTCPAGLNIVSSFDGSGRNIFATVSFKSTKKSVAKVNKTTGEITGVKKGSATIKATFVMPDGTKKTYKIKVKIKK